MKKWFIIGGITGALVIGVAALGIAAFSFLPTPANAQEGPRAIPRIMRGALSFEGQGRFGPMDQLGPQGLNGPGLFGGKIDRDALLADALGITVEELQAAQDKAHEAAVQQAVDEGLITQNQADMMVAGYKLRNYVDRDAVMAKALGISVEELQAARDEGKPLAVIIYEQDLDPATLRSNMQAAFEEAVQQAVADGVITQEQADQITTGQGFGFGRGDFGGHRGGFGGFGLK